jgi:hypothetical protein
MPLASNSFLISSRIRSSCAKGVQLDNYTQRYGIAVSQKSLSFRLTGALDGKIRPKRPILGDMFDTAERYAHQAVAGTITTILSKPG